MPPAADGATGPAADRSIGLLQAALLAMLVGGLLYLLYRPTSLLMFRWFEALGLDSAVEQLRAVATQHPRPPAWAINSLPHALWLLSGLLLFAWIWRGRAGSAASAWMGVLVAFAAGGEIGQWCGLVPGTFDPIDLALVVAACIAFLAIARGRWLPWRTA